MNFFDIRCQTGPFSDAELGLCDDQVSPVAYIDVTNQQEWVATIKNPNQKFITFTAIDKCVIKDHEERRRERCDCMLTTDEALYLVELKDWSGKNWQGHAIKQLDSTIRFLIAAHGEHLLTKYRPKIAYISNKKSPFVKPALNTKNLFYSKYNFRLKIEATIHVR